jgi:WD40 repeat protein/DNA-binding MarR family transcriptional regulator
VSSPYKGLAAFEDSDLDTLFFFGRARERDVVVANLLASRLTVLYGESGVGKSSLLQAAVLRALRAAAPEAEVALYTTWSLPSDDVFAAVRDADESYLILDQFEESFLYDQHALVETLPELLRTSRAHVLVSLREDALSRLDVFKAQLPQIFANQLRLDHLDREAARAAILGPLDRWFELTGERVTAESELVDAILDEVSSGGRVEAPYLQLVLERIWEAEHATGSPILRLQTLRGVGGATTIVSDHVDAALAALPPDQQDAAASVLDHLVTPSGTKIAHRVADLAEYAAVPRERVTRVLDRLSRERIVRSVDGSDRFEIFHDVLAEPLTAWRAAREVELERASARRRQRRLLAVIAAALIALAVVGGLAVWAFVERGTARSQARHAHARELEATALQQLTVDPRQSLRSALAAALLEPGAASESVLRQSLLADRLHHAVAVGGAVRAVAWSPDDRYVAAAAPHGRIVVVDARSGKRLRTLAANRAVASLGFEADGRTLVAGRPGGGARSWNVETGAVVAASRHLLVATDVRGRAVLVPTRGRLAQVAPHATAARVGPAGAPLAAIVADRGGRKRVWLFAPNGKLLRILPKRGLADLSYAPDGRLLATASADGDVTLWNPRTGRRVHVLRDTGSAVVTVAFSPDGTLLASANQDGGVRVWTMANAQRLFYFVGHANPVTALAWSPDGRVVASASSDRTVRIWGVTRIVAAGVQVALLAGARDAVRSLAFSPDGQQLAAGSDDGRVRLWDASSEQRLRVLGRARGGFSDAVWLGPSRVAAAAPDGVHVYSRHALLRVVRVRGVRELAVDRGTLYGVTSTGIVNVLLNGAPVYKDATTMAVAGTRIMAGRGTEVFGHGRTFSVPGGVVRLALSPDRRILATADADGTVRLFDVGSGRLMHVLRGHHAAVTDVAFSPDGTLLATSSRDTRAILWNVATGRRLRVLSGHFGTVAAVAFSPDGRWVVTAGPISAGLWPTSTGRLLFYLRGDTRALTAVAFSPDGGTILTASKDGTVRTYACTVCGTLPALERVAEQRLRG